MNLGRNVPSCKHSSFMARHFFYPPSKKIRSLLFSSGLLLVGMGLLMSPSIHPTQADTISNDQFNANYQQAQANYDVTGTWGTSKYYVDSNGALHIGSGQLLGSMYSVLGSGVNSITAIDIDQPVQAPQNSGDLFNGADQSQDPEGGLSTDGSEANTTITAINGLPNLDTSQAHAIDFMFGYNKSLKYLDTSNLNTSHATESAGMFSFDQSITDLDLSNMDTSHMGDMIGTFENMSSLQNLNISDWNTTSATMMDRMFENDPSLTNVDLSGWHTPKLTDMDEFFVGDSALQSYDMSNFDTTNANMTGFWGNVDRQINHFRLGPKTYMKSNFGTAPATDWHDENVNKYTNILQLTNQQNNISGSTTGAAMRNAKAYPGDWHISQFGKDLHVARHNNQKVGTWGASVYYLDKNNGLHVSSGEPQGSLSNALGSDVASSLTSVQFTEPITFPADSSNLLSNLGNVRSIDGLNHADTSRTTNMDSMLANDNGLQKLDLSNFDTSHVNDMSGFLSNSKNIYDIKLGDHTALKNDDALTPGTWKNNGQALSSDQLSNGDAHPGEWQDPFGIGYHQAQSNGWRTGQWGTAKYYIDNENNMHVSSGQLLGSLYNTIGYTADSLNTLNFDEPVQAPQDSSYLLSGESSGGNNTSSIRRIDGLNLLDTSRTTSMNSILAGNPNLDALDLSSWDMSHVQDMSGMFYDDAQLKDLNVHHWDTRQATNMEWMFRNDTSLVNLDLSDWHTTPALNNMGYMFDNDPALHSFDISNFDTTNANMYELWGNNDMSIDQMTLGNKTYLKSNFGQFPGVSWQNGNDYKNGRDLINYDYTSKVPQPTGSQVANLKTYPGTWTKTPFNNAYYAAKNAGDKTGFWGSAPFYIDNGGILNVGTGELQGTLSNLLRNINLIPDSISSLSVEEPIRTPRDSSYLFSGINYQNDNLSVINGTNHFDTSQTTDMNGMFAHNPNLDNLNLTNFDMTNVHDKSGMFNDDENITDITLGSRTPLSHDDNLVHRYWQNGKNYLNTDQLNDGNTHPGTWQISDFDRGMMRAKKYGWQYGTWGTSPYYIDPNDNLHVGNGRLDGSLPNLLGESRTKSLRTINIDQPAQAPDNSYQLFAYATNAQNINGLTELDTSQTTSMHEMFINDHDIHDLDISNWNTSHVRDMVGMFNSTFSLTDLDLSHFDTSSVTDMSFAFWEDFHLQRLDLSDWDTSHVTNMSDAFDANNSLEKLSLGDRTRLQGDRIGLSRAWHNGSPTWTNGSQNINSQQLEDGNSHPGTWEWTPFSHGLMDAKRQGHPTGTWGTAPYYMDSNNAMHIGSGQLQGSLDSILGDATANMVSAVKIDENVQAPADAQGLFSAGNSNDSLLSIDHADRIDTSQMNDMDGMFANDHALQNVDTEHFDTSHVTSMNATFANDSSINNLRLGDWNVDQVTDMQGMFNHDNNLNNPVGIENWQVDHVNDMSNMFANDSSLTDLNLSDWQPTAQTDLTGMFNGATSLSNLDISEFDSNKTTNMFGTDNVHNDDRINDIALSDHIDLSNAHLPDGIWQDGDFMMDTKQLVDHRYSGIWHRVQTKQGANLVGSVNNTLHQLISSSFNLPDDNDRIHIMNDQGSLGEDQEHLQAGNYVRVIYSYKDNSGNLNYYTSDLSVYDYSQGDPLQGDNGQSLQKLLDDHCHANVTIDDNGGLDPNKMSIGRYTVQYHYQDSQGHWKYLTSPLTVTKTTYVSLPFLITTDDPQSELNDKEDIEEKLTQFFGMDDSADLQLQPAQDSGLDNAMNYRLTEDDDQYTGTLSIAKNPTSEQEMKNIPSASDQQFWNSDVMNTWNMSHFNLDHNDINNYTRDDSTGDTHVQGNLYPAPNQFVNNPTIPYDLHIEMLSKEYSVTNGTVNDHQVQDVINSIDPDAQVISVTDGAGKDATASYGQLSTISNNANIVIKLRTHSGYVNVRFSQVGDLVEPNVDITHNVATQGADINNDDLQDQIMSRTHEPLLNNFTVDNTQQVSSHVKQIDYHFTKDANAVGDNVNVETNNVTVSGTAYVHYLSDNTNDDPTFTVVQGDNAVQHMENVLGHDITITQAPNDGSNVNDLPVGSFNVGYQDSNILDDENDTTYHATITVIPDYYFSPATTNTNFNDTTNTPGEFKPYDYQNGDSSYKSVVDTGNHGNDDNPSSNPNSNDETVDGLHTQDNKPAHFTPDNPYLKK